MGGLWGRKVELGGLKDVTWFILLGIRNLSSSDFRFKAFNLFYSFIIFLTVYKKLVDNTF